MLKDKHFAILDKRKHLVLLDSLVNNDCAFDYQPGDGTRYVLLFKRIGEGERRAVGGAPNSVLLSYFRGSNSFQSMLATEYSLPVYIEEKLKCNSPTAEMIYKVVDFFFNGTDVGPSRYEKGAE